MVLGQRVESGRFLLDGFRVGMALHALASAFMGWLYAVVIAEHVQHWPAVLEVLLILGYALVHWATWQYVLMPWLAPVMNRNSTPASLAVAHLACGAAFAASFLPFSGQ